MGDSGIDVIATTMSGSIKDWGKIEKMEPLFKQHGREDVSIHAVDSHAEARTLTRNLIEGGTRTVISAGGSGTFNSVLEGCIDSQVGLGNITLGFLRKGSADLLGKALGMPDDIEEAVAVFVESLARNRTVGCDVIQATSGEPESVPRHFVGYGGAEIFGRIPHYTERKFTKYYKGVLSQLFSDLGPFFVGASLATMDRTVKRILRGGTSWTISIDGDEVSQGRYQTMIIVNGDLGPDLPFARGAPLGSGCFHMFAIRDLGLLKFPGQFKRAWKASITDQAQEWGFEEYCIKDVLKIEPGRDALFPVNVDGSTMLCRSWATFKIVDQINLISRD